MHHIVAQPMPINVPSVFQATGSVREPILEIVPWLRRTEVFQAYQRAFETTTGLPLAIRAAGSFEPPLHTSKRANPFCALMARRNRSCAACLETQQRIEDAATLEPTTLQCFAGLSESAVAVRAGEKVVGYLQTGQVLFQPPSKAECRRIKRQLSEWALEADEGELARAYFQTRVITKERYASVFRLVAIFAEHLSLLAGQFAAAAAAESPVVVKARSFIWEHCDEEIFVTQVARVVGLSSFYFCKIFKRATGLRFTDFVARVRVEKTKHLLLDPHMQISEAAFAAGFQSLSQFNRVFRRIVGDAPSAFRERLHHTPARAARRGADRRAA